MLFMLLIFRGLTFVVVLLPVKCLIIRLLMCISRSAWLPECLFQADEYGIVV